MTGGVLLGLVGVFVLTQVLGGDALGRLGITGAATNPGTTSTGSGLAAGIGRIAEGLPGPGQAMPSTVQ